MDNCKTLVDVMQYRATVSPQQPAFIFRGFNGSRSELTFADVYRLGGRWANVLKSSGLGRGSLVANTLLNSPERVVCEAAILLSGAASVNAQCLMADGSDLLRILQQSRAIAIVLDPDVTNSPWGVLSKHVKMDKDNCVTSQELPSLKKVFFIKRNAEDSHEDFLSQLQRMDTWFQADDINENDICTVFTTSGSTGFSKLVVFTHEAYVQINFYFSLEFESEMEKGRLFSLAQLGWSAGYTGMTFLFGNTRVLYDMRGPGRPNNQYEFLWNTIAEEKCTLALFMPSAAINLIQHNRQSERKSSDKKSQWVLDTLMLASLPVTQQALEAIGLLTKSLRTIYAGTEMKFVCVSEPVDKTQFVDCDVGIPLPDCQVKIVSDDGKDTILPVDTEGHILLKKKYMFREYLNDPVATAAAFTADGFFKTGDIGKIDSHGHLFVYGRGSDAINGHYIVYPGWLETRIKACPGVMDVIVVGVPDPFPLEEICACVILKSIGVTIEDVRAFVEKDIISTTDDPMSPRPRYYLEFKSFPLTDTGKPVRRLIKQIAERAIVLPLLLK